MGDADAEITEATYRALCEDGSAGVTMQRVADHTDESKAALRYHSDTKQALLQAFLEHLADWFEAELATDAADPETRLRSVVATVFDRAGADRGEYATALPEIKARVPYDERLRRTVRDAVRDGVDRGVFADVDPDAIARFVATATDGGHVPEAALGEDPPETRALVESYLGPELGTDFDAEGRA